MICTGRSIFSETSAILQVFFFLCGIIMKDGTCIAGQRQNDPHSVNAEWGSSVKNTVKEICQACLIYPQNPWQALMHQSVLCVL